MCWHKDQRKDFVRKSCHVGIPNSKHIPVDIHCKDHQCNYAGRNIPQLHFGLYIRHWVRMEMGHKGEVFLQVKLLAQLQNI